MGRRHVDSPKRQSLDAYCCTGKPHRVLSQGGMLEGSTGLPLPSVSWSESLICFQGKTDPTLLRFSEIILKLPLYKVVIIGIYNGRKDPF